MATFFYFDEANRKRGPLTPAQVKALAEQGVITPDTPMMTDTGKRGLAKQLPGLFATPAAQPPTPKTGRQPTAASVASATADRNNGNVSRRQSAIADIAARRSAIYLAAAVSLVAVIGLAVIFIPNREPTKPHSEPATVPPQTNTVDTTPNHLAGTPALDTPATLEPMDTGVPAKKPEVTPPQPLSAPAAPPLALGRTPAPPPAPPQRQLPPGWTPEKIATIEQLKNEIRGWWGSHAGGCVTTVLAEFNGFVDPIDPILVGKNIVFTPRWLEYIGTDKPLTQQQFEFWRDRTDKVYESFEELTGRTPRKGRIIVCALQPVSMFASPSHKAHAHSGNTNLFCINYSQSNNAFKTTLQKISSHNFCITTIHEMAHIFAGGELWNVEPESVVILFIDYALENIPRARYDGTSNQIITTTTHSTYRRGFYNRALDNFKAGTIGAFSNSVASRRGSSYELYLYGLVDKVGWDTYKKVYRSYNDANFKPNIYVGSTYTGDMLEYKIARVRDLFDRIEYFSGQSGVLRTLPDRGELLDKHFNPQVLERNL